MVGTNKKHSLCAGCLVLLSACCASHSAVSSLEDVISESDRVRLSKLFEAAEPYENDVETPFYLISGLQVIGFDQSNKAMRDRACTMAKSVKNAELKNVFYSTSIAAMIDGCEVSMYSLVEERC